MNANPTRSLAVGITARSLLDLRADDDVLRDHGRAAYGRYQLERQDEALPAGPGLPVVRALLEAGRAGERGVEIVVLSESIADASLRVLSSARHYDLEVRRAAFTGGEPLAPYLQALRVDLFLSDDAEETTVATDNGVAAALVQPGADAPEQSGLRIAVEGGAILLGAESEQENGESRTGVMRSQDAAVPRWIAALAGLQRIGGGGERLIRTALISSEEAPARERILAALRSWEIELDQAFFSEAHSKADVLAAFRPHIVFDVLRRPGDERQPVEPRSEEPESTLRSRLRLRA